MLLTIRHSTTYRYAQDVALLPHRMMLVPRGSHSLKLRCATLNCAPAASIEWTQDVFGNLIATAAFAGAASMLTITSDISVEQDAAAWPVFNIAPHAHQYPFAYSDDELTDLGALRYPEHADPEGRLGAWARGIVARDRTDTLALLQDLNAAARSGIVYVEREEEGTQTPLETMRRRSGSCRDLATLFIEAARQLGLGARAVSGYLHNPLAPGSGNPEPTQHGATHAWAEIYLPCAGWITFDPTNGRMGEAHLIPIAVARNIAQIPPIAGSFVGARENFMAMSVVVMVTSTDDHGDEMTAAA